MESQNLRKKLQRREKRQILHGEGKVGAMRYFLVFVVFWGLSLSAGSGPAFAQQNMQCIASAGQAILKTTHPVKTIADYRTMTECEQSRLNSRGGVVCVWFTPDMTIGPGGWDETGWRAMNIQTKVGLGRKTHSTFEDCLLATKNANGGVVCTNTGVGYKAANISTNMWCGASSQLKYCVQASLAAKNNHVCSFPSDGTGAGAGWVLTKVTSTCEYLSGQKTLAECNKLIP